MRKITANSIGLEAGAAGALLTGREKRDYVFEGMPLELSRCGAVSKPAGAMPSALFAIAASSPNPSARCSKLANSIRMPPAFHAEAVWATAFFSCFSVQNVARKCPKIAKWSLKFKIDANKVHNRH